MFLPKTNRRIIPRWRDFWTTAVLGQLSPATVKIDRALLPGANDLEAREAWHSRPTLWHALDLIGTAFVIGDVTHPDVLSAAKYLESRSDECPGPARRLVSRVLHPEEEIDGLVEVSHANTAAIRTEIRTKRRRLYAEPRNSLLWTDLARLYTRLGQQDKAQHAIDMSCHLASDNRFVIRSAARFLVHVGDYQKALSLLRKTVLNQSDPWVVAAEIGISSFSDSDARFLKLGRRMVDSQDFSEFAKSELASAIATIDLNEGNRKAAKKLFKQSLALPTENSVAQAEWASAQVGELVLPANQDNVPRNYEAKSQHAYRLGDWETALLNADKWLNDQPFSSRPAGVLSYLYSAIFEKYEDALDVLRFSLISNPGDRLLTNNLAFNLINLGRLEEADSMLRGIDPRVFDDSSTITLIATQGLLLFRQGLKQVGRTLYLEAIDLAKRKSNFHYAALAALYLAIEEIRADAETKAQTLKYALQLASRTDEPDVRHLSARLTTMAKVAKLLLE